MKTPPPPSSSKHSVRPGQSSTRTHASRRRWRLAAACLAGLSLGVAAWSAAQTAKPNAANPAPPPLQDSEPPVTPERELGRLAILQPVEFERFARQAKTPQQLQEEEIAKFAIGQPKAYAAEFEGFKDAGRRQLEQDARAAVLDPVRHSGSVAQLKMDLRAKRAQGDKITEVVRPAGSPKPSR
ncbi:MAG: hypothetical protein HY735_09965 [Verrucomicrobia bacterium]|nr:hypothetical protein [Verrucomicrobiota bacterium]